MSIIHVNQEGYRIIIWRMRGVLIGLIIHTQNFYTILKNNSSFS